MFRRPSLRVNKAGYVPGKIRELKPQVSPYANKKSRALVGRPAEEHPQAARRIPLVV